MSLNIYYTCIYFFLVQHVCLRCVFMLTHRPLHAGLFLLATSQLYCERGLFGFE